MCEEDVWIDGEITHYVKLWGCPHFGFWGGAANLKLLITYQAFLVHFYVYKGNDLNLVNDNA